MTGHTRDLTFPAVINLLQDREWHAADELNAITSFPSEWLREVERDYELERRAGSPELVRLAAGPIQRTA